MLHIYVARVAIVKWSTEHKSLRFDYIYKHMVLKKSIMTLFCLHLQWWDVEDQYNESFSVYYIMCETPYALINNPILNEMSNQVYT